MAIQAKPGQTLRVTITKTINRASARKTVQRLFLQDKSHSDPIEIRSALWNIERAFHSKRLKFFC